MGSNFNINTGFKIGGFEKAIEEYNKSFSPNFGALNNSDFDKIFNSMPQTQPLQAHTQYTIGLDSINAQKIENISPTAKMAKDIGSELSNSINELNSVTKQAEKDFETFASGGDISIHDVMISAEKSNLAMQMAIQLRNQMLSAYNEFKNMQF